MNNKFLFTICLILIALIDFGCASVTNASNKTHTCNPTVNLKQQNQNVIHEQNEIINTQIINVTKEENI